LGSHWDVATTPDGLFRETQERLSHRNCWTRVGFVDTGAFIVLKQAHLNEERTQMPTIHDLRQTYCKMGDEELREIALFETKELSDDATRVLREEMGRRGLLDRFEEIISAQRQTFTLDQVDDMIRQLRQLPCKMCGIPGLTIHGREIVTHRGFLLRTKEEVFHIGCATCIKQAARSANITTLLFTILRFPLGLIFAFVTVLENLRASDCEETEEATKEFQDYVRQNLGVITLLLQSEHKTQSLVNELN
jgi:hypothetical protein